MRHPLFLTLIILLSHAAHAEIVEQRVDYRQGDTDLRGYLYYDNTLSAVRPGVLVLHEWWGNNDFARGKARELAEMGYVAFAADMYGNGRTTKDGDEAQAWATPFYENPQLFRDRARAGLEVLGSHPLTRDRPLAAIGFCFGGTAALQLACTNPDRLAGVVSFHGSPMPPREADPDPIRPAVLICHGSADPLVPNEQVRAAVEGFEAHHATVTLAEYDAKHSFTNPSADGSFHEGVMYDEDAAAESWADMQDFFEMVFVPASAE